MSIAANLSWAARQPIFALRCSWIKRARRRAGLRTGEGTSVHPDAVIHDPHLVTIGAGSRLSACTILTHNGADIITSRKLGRKVDTTRGVFIGEDTFIGWGAIILPGTIIGDNCVIGAGVTIGGRVRSGTVIGANRSLPAESIDAYRGRIEALHPPRHYTHMTGRDA